jgi:hypothetical protein
MKKQMTKVMFVAVVAASTIIGCKKDKDEVPNPPPPANEEEVITTLKLIFTDSANTSNTITATFKDPDGDGGQGVTIHDTIQLQANKTYLVDILLLNEVASPVDTISNEVAEEANDHHFFFHYSGVNITTTYLDSDTNTPPLPLGLSTKWKTGAAANGTSQVILKHQPDVKDGSQAPGETDIDVTFQTKIE